MRQKPGQDAHDAVAPRGVDAASASQRSCNPHDPPYHSDSGTKATIPKVVAAEQLQLNLQPELTTNSLNSN